jgi:hypothetical protein
MQCDGDGYQSWTKFKLIRSVKITAKGKNKQRFLVNQV